LIEIEYRKFLQSYPDRAEPADFGPVQR
jgi:hypothetical protein